MKEGIWGKGVSCDSFGYFRCGKMAAMALDVLAVPLADFVEVALGDLRFPVGECFGDFGKPLGGVEGAKRVGGEVAIEAKRPVNILQAAGAVVFRDDAEVFFHFGIPHFWEIFYFEFSFDKGFFNFISDDDVENIGYLIGMDSYEGGVDSVDGSV